MTIAPGLREAASVARSRAHLIRSTTKGGSAIAIGLEDLAEELEGMARRAQSRITERAPLTSPAAAPTRAAE